MAESHEKSGMSMVQYLSRVIGWFVKQDPSFQSEVLAGLGDPIDRLARDRIAQLILKGDARLTFDQSLQAVQRLLQVMQTMHTAAIREVKDAHNEPAKKEKP